MHRLALIAVFALSCHPRPGAKSQRTVVISVVGTNDLHGNITTLPILAGHLDVIRKLRAKDGAMLLVDAGDMLHGTLTSNLNEGATVIRAYNEMGYAAAALGNHDFDFGPVGPEVISKTPAQKWGALKARASEAEFPLLCANLYRDTGERIDWPNVKPSALIEVAGVRVGLIGVVTAELPLVVRPAHFAGLSVEDLATAIIREARDLRERGAQVVLVLAHAGGRCTEFDDPTDLSSCKQTDEIFEVARALPPGGVDAILGGHKHRGIAHMVNGIPVVDAYAHGRAFSRIDFRISSGRIVQTELFPPRDLCEQPYLHRACRSAPYEGHNVMPSPRIAKLIEPAIADAQVLTREPLGVRIETPVKRSQTDESPLGNLFADLMLASHPDRDLALNNGGALRAGLDEGQLTYGKLYAAMSFDNRFATVHILAGDLRRDLARAFETSEDVVSVSGARIEASCQNGKVAVGLYWPDGSPIDDGETISVLTSDYLATRGDALFSLQTLRKGRVEFDDGPMIRDAMAEALRARGGVIRGDDPALYDPDDRRVSYPSPPPITCP